jgi:GNAT superfamily N-acetyltransferase
MDELSLAEREMTDAEFARMKAGFAEHGRQHGNPPETAERFGFVLTDGDRFVGCSSGLAYKSELGYSGYFFLTDLFVEKEYRGRGYGTRLLAAIEAKLATLGVKCIWTWTGAHEGRGFYLKRGYEVFCEQEGWCQAGQSRFGMRKGLQLRET